MLLKKVYLTVMIISIFQGSFLSAVDFVLFTQPKTGTHLVTPILAELTGKRPYCPRNYMKEKSQGYKKFKL